MRRYITEFVALFFFGALIWVLVKPDSVGVQAVQAFGDGMSALIKTVVAE